MFRMRRPFFFGDFMNLTDEDEIRLIETYRGDASFRSYLSKYKSRIAGAQERECPPLSTLKVIEASFFDNGPQEKKAAGRSKSQYALNLKGWKSAGDIDLASGDWTINVSLHDRQSFLSTIKRQSDKGTISHEYHDTLVHATDMFNDDDVHYFGHFCHFAAGQTYFDHQYCVLKIEDGVPSVFVLVNGDINDCLNVYDGWSGTLFTGQKLKHPVKFQLRWDVSGEYCDQRPNWATN